jgi:hypothetical protein
MSIIEEIKENNKQQVIKLLRKDVIRHVFALYDLQHDPKHTKMYAAFEKENLEGYILIYTATEFPSVILEGGKDVAQRLINYAPKKRCIFHIPKHLLSIIEHKFPDVKHYTESWMLIKRKEATIFKSSNVRKLCASKDAEELMMLLSSREDRPIRNIDKYMDRIGKMPFYGVHRR